MAQNDTTQSNQLLYPSINAPQPAQEGYIQPPAQQSSVPTANGEYNIPLPPVAVQPVSPPPVQQLVAPPVANYPPPPPQPAYQPPVYPPQSYGNVPPPTYAPNQAPLIQQSQEMIPLDNYHHMQWRPENYIVVKRARLILWISIIQGVAAIFYCLFFFWLWFWTIPLSFCGTYGAKMLANAFVIAFGVLQLLKIVVNLGLTIIFPTGGMIFGFLVTTVANIIYLLFTYYFYKALKTKTQEEKNMLRPCIGWSCQCCS